jgi:predicted ATP-binding protein involved in virulence
MTEDEIRKFDQDSDKLLLKTFNSTIISMIPDNHWQDMAFSFAVEDLTGIFVTPSGKKEKLQFRQLSDGYRNIIGMVADIAYRCIKLNPHLGEMAVKDTPGIVLIDELDLHLHPNWQRRIVNDLKIAFPKIQFIATTHSPFITQSLKSDEIWNLDKLMDVAPDELKIDTVATEIMGVSSAYSESNEGLYNKSKKFMEDLESNKSVGELQKELDEISDPAVRAFLELHKISKGK